MFTEKQIEILKETKNVEFCDSPSFSYNVNQNRISRPDDFPTDFHIAERVLNYHFKNFNDFLKIVLNHDKIVVFNKVLEIQDGIGVRYNVMPTKWEVRPLVENKSTFISSNNNSEIKIPGGTLRFQPDRENY